MGFGVRATQKGTIKGGWVFLSNSSRKCGKTGKPYITVVLHFKCAKSANRRYVTADIRTEKFRKERDCPASEHAQNTFVITCVALVASYWRFPCKHKYTVKYGTVHETSLCSIPFLSEKKVTDAINDRAHAIGLHGH